MAFSTASAPVENRPVRFSKSPGVFRFSHAQTLVKDSYSVTMKQVWVKAASWAATRSATSLLLAPREVTAMPEAKSIRRLPSTSSMMPPSARVTKTGSVMPKPLVTCAVRSACSSVERGPGMAVARWRVCGRVAASAARRVSVMGSTLCE